MKRGFPLVSVVVGVCVVATVGLFSSGLLPPGISLMVDDSAQLIVGAGATVSCWWTAHRRRGVEKRWRILMGAGTAGWTVGMAIWAWYRTFADTPLPSPSAADVGFLTLPVFALPALLAFATEGIPVNDRVDGTARGAARTHAVLVLDGLVVTGSLFLLTWTTALGAVVRAGAPTALGFAVAIAYPITDLVLVVIVILLVSFRRVRQQRQLLLLGLGLVALSVSDSVFAYLVSSGAGEMHLLADTGFIAGPALIALAALVPEKRVTAPADSHPETADWTHLLLPYAPLAVTGTFVTIRAVLGPAMNSIGVVAILGGFLVVLVVVRQLVTLIDNTFLLDRVHEERERVVHQAFHDPLTGLANRTLFHNRLDRAVELNHNENRPFGLLFVDLDDFKAINDSLGHAAGDALLRAVADRLRDCVRSVDTVARLGGDEFAILLETEREVPELVGKRVAAALEHPFTAEGRSRTVGASLGMVVSASIDMPLTTEALLQRADSAMYAVKRRRKATAATTAHKPGTSVGTANEPELSTRLAAALGEQPDHGGLSVHYQPITSLADGSAVAVEALARWNEPALGVVPPDVFVGVAERTGLVADLDAFVLERACRELVSLPGWREAPLTLHVNLSAARLGEQELERTVRRVLHRYELPGDKLTLEITETSPVTDFDVAADMVQRLRQLHVRFALDDFGTGYNSLVHLHRLPVDMLKLDRTFTLADNPVDRQRAQALRRSVLSLSHALDILVVVEGIETEKQACELSRLGYELGQGYLYGKPVPLDQLRLT